MADNIYLVDVKSQKSHELGRFNEGKATRTDIMVRAYKRSNLDTLACVSDYALRTGRDRSLVPLTNVVEEFIRRQA